MTHFDSLNNHSSQPSETGATNTNTNTNANTNTAANSLIFPPSAAAEVSALAAQLNLPRDFAFGTSTASYQIEGGAQNGGRGPSIWDTFAHTPGKIIDSTTGDTTSDHFHHWREDIALMGKAGLKNYRLSLSWSRLFPDGTVGAGPNRQGVDFYKNLLEGLRGAEINPMVTLYHWDLPQPLQDIGGCQNPEVIKRFAEYASATYELYDDLVTHWIPINEPNVHTLLGHAIGIHAPGLALGYQALGVGHALNLAHGAAVRALRDQGATSIGCATNHCPVLPADSNNPLDVQMAGLYHEVYNLFYSDAMLRGAYPEQLLSVIASEVGAEVSESMAAEVTSACEPLDFYGVNYYEPAVVRARDEDAENESASLAAEASASEKEEPTSVDGAEQFNLPEGIPFEIESLPTQERTGFDWAIYPQGLTTTLVDLQQRYGQELPPLVITESGMSSPDEVEETAEGQEEGQTVARVRDTARIDYLAGHIRAVADARAQGVDVRGYYVWSLMDNWEWADGLRQRFGLVHIDYSDPERRRVPKDSFHWYAALANAVGHGPEADE